MANGHQSLTIVGNLGRDPELRQDNNGNQWCSFNVAVNEGDYGTKWFSVSVMGKTAENCAKYLSKGKQILVEGRLKADENGSPRIWSRNDGTPAASFEVFGTRVLFLSGGGVEGQKEAVHHNEEFPF
jgi:single-strand DNA-binding protein